ncbi:unnamed protein product [Tuber melanosporum]|uniref:(Perigord truffle) hypothetical protein n=1 Tax=Tuber melanosporum (strain Mel28) TaxID=656061 RepID=D5GQ45_TUBMM|nr:uncharacterized protein GSTUM_00012194001 [Tuber melanosporum]CAZ86638.1 unnamed protein product [Tuber melanosporum]
MTPHLPINLRLSTFIHDITVRYSPHLRIAIASTWADLLMPYQAGKVLFTAQYQARKKSKLQPYS